MARAVHRGRPILAQPRPGQQPRQAKQRSFDAVLFDVYNDRRWFSAHMKRKRVRLLAVAGKVAGMHSKKVLLSSLALALLMLRGCTVAGVQTRDDWFEVGESPLVEANVELARLTVRAGTSGRVQIQATLRHPSKTNYQVQQAGDTIRIDVQMQQGFSSKIDQPAVEIIVSVPRSTNLDLRSSTGYLYVDEVSGHIMLATSSGGIHLSDCEGRIALENRTGTIECRRVQGELHVRSDAGSVDLDTVKGTFDVQTASGRIRFEGELASAAEHRFQSDTGSVDLVLLGSPDLTLAATSETGSVRCTVEFVEQVRTNRACKGILGTGTGQLQVGTSTGSITIR